MTLLSQLVGRARRRIRDARASTAPGSAPAGRTSAATIDLEDPAVARDPFPYYEELRREGAVLYLPRHGCWIVLGAEAAQAAFRLPSVFSNRPYEDVDAVLLAADPPEHAAVRRVVASCFSKATIHSLGGIAAEAADRLLKPRLEIVSEYARPLSEEVAAALLGADEAALRLVRDTLVRCTDFTALVQELDRWAVRTEMYPRLRADGMDDGQARSLVRLLWLASTKTAERVTAECVNRLILHEDVRRVLVGDPAQIVPFVEEVMRLHPPEPMLRRQALVPAELGGVLIPAGATVYLCIAAANRDPARFEAPGELRIDRKSASQLTFGHGIHHCVGAALGRAQVRAAVRALLTRAPHLRAVEPQDRVPYRASMTVHYIERLVVDTGRRHGSGAP